MSQPIVAIDYVVDGPRTAAAVANGESQLLAVEYLDPAGGIHRVSPDVFASELRQLLSHPRLYWDAPFGRMVEAKYGIPLADTFHDSGVLVHLHTGQPRKLHREGGSHVRDVYDAFSQLHPLTSANGGGYVYGSIELPVVDPTVAMTATGLRLEMALLQQREEQLLAAKQQLNRQIHAITGRTLNAQSSMELAHYLYHELRLPVVEYSEHGLPSLSNSALDELAHLHPVIPLLRAYRHQVTRYRACHQLLACSRSGRARAHLDPLGTGTGRFACSQPAVLSLPKELRDLVIADDGQVLISADLSQAELRVLAQLSQDRLLLDGFGRTDIDMHRRTAARIYGVDEDSVTPEQRAVGKQENFAAIYGHTPETFLCAYPEAARWIHAVQQQALSNGYVQTMYGRRRCLPDVFDPFCQADALRQAVNSVVQGTAADICKLMLSRIYYELGGECQLLMTVYDSVLLQVPVREVRDFVPVLRQVAEEPPPGFEVPLRVDIGIGRSWAECCSNAAGDNTEQMRLAVS